mgnify:CR=1 FL=1
MTELKTLKDLIEIQKIRIIDDAELKDIFITEKGFEPKFYVNKFHFEERKIVDYEKERQEAIKWIKELSKNLDIEKLFKERQESYTPESRALIDEQTWELCKKADFEIIIRNANNSENKIDFIKHFFDISEEDLK